MSQDSDRFTNPSSKGSGVAPEYQDHEERAGWYIAAIAWTILVLAKVIEGSVILVSMIFERAIRAWRNWRGGRTNALVVFGKSTQWGDPELGFSMGIGVVLVLMGVLGALAWGALKGTDPPMAERDEVAKVIIAKDEDTLYGLAANQGVSPDDMIAANIDLLRENTKRCLEMDKSRRYYAGYTENGKALRPSLTCVMVQWNGERLAIHTLWAGQAVTFPTYRDGSVSGEEASMARTDR